MLHTIGPFIQSLLQNQIILGINRVRHLTGILKWDFFVPTFITYRLLTLERINTVQWNIQVRQRHADRRVPCILRNIECTGQIQSYLGKVTRITHTRRLGIIWILLRIIQTTQVTLVITTGCKVHISRKRTVGTGLGILSVAPCNSEVFCNHIVRHILLTCLRYQITGIEITTISVSFIIIGLRGKSPWALCKNLTQHFQIHTITDSKIISTIT